MSRNTLAICLGTGLALFIGSVWKAENRRYQDRCRQAMQKRPPVEIHTWEGEGGNVMEPSTLVAPMPA